MVDMIPRSVSMRLQNRGPYWEFQYVKMLLLFLEDPPSRRKAVLEQRKDIKGWKEKVRYTMRCIVEAIFSGTKRRFGEYLFSTREKHRCVELWLRTILWNVLIYPR
jgi:hypothetical protein